MAALNRRLARLEQSAGELMPDQQRCACCQARPLLAFSDEPENTGPPQPYSGPSGTCPLCRMPPPGKDVLTLPAQIAELFATLPWADEPRLRFIEKLLLLKAIAQREIGEVDRIVRSLCERDANGQRRWRWPERVASAPVSPNQETAC